MTPDISKLVNLRVLKLSRNTVLKRIPESISCLQNLQSLVIKNSQISKLPAGIARLANLRTLAVKSNYLSREPVEVPPCLKVRDFVLPRLPFIPAHRLLSSKQGKGRWNFVQVGFPVDSYNFVQVGFLWILG
jgi:hypothetical protein